MRLRHRLSQLSGFSDQAQVQLWETALGVHGERWFWPAESETPGERVHVYRSPDEGYGGATLTFASREGEYRCQGPWHSNSDALYRATGVDLRATHRTWGVVARERTREGYDEVLEGVLHEDPPEGVIGLFDRVDLIAQALADETRVTLAVYRQSRGGSRSGWAYPTHCCTIGRCEVTYRVMQGAPHLVTVDGAPPHRPYGRLMEAVKKLLPGLVKRQEDDE